MTKKLTMLEALDWCRENPAFNQCRGFLGGDLEMGAGKSDGYGLAAFESKANNFRGKR